jgi:hypothetical protein
MGRDPEKVDMNTKHDSVEEPIRDDEKRSSRKEIADSNSVHSHSTNDTIEEIPEGLEQDTKQAQRTKSSSSSTRTRTAIIVPRAKRRGFLARLTVIPEVERPYDYKNRTKWFITFQVAIAAAAAPMGSAILLRECRPL